MELYIVAVPIGHPEDASLRMRKVLESSDIIYCEDTRKFKDLCRRIPLHVKASLRTLPGQEDLEKDWKRELEALPIDTQIALVSDAGTPVVNDPGRGLLQALRKLEIKTTVVPGPSAPIAAWSWSGGFGLPFYFAGFAPKAKETAKKQWEDFFASLKSVGTFCFFDMRHQVLSTLKALEGLGLAQTEVFLAREMTKPHEELFFGSVLDAQDWIAKRLEKDQVGELCVLLEGKAAKASQVATSLTPEELLQIRMAPPKEAAKILAKATGLSARECYHKIINHHE